MHAQQALAKLRRDLTVSRIVQGILLVAVILCLLLDQVLAQGFFNGAVALAIVGGAWLYLSYQSMKGQRLAASSPGLIATGQLEQAERIIEQSMNSFSLFRGMKLRTLHQLMMLRHAQQRWQEAALLSQGLLRQKLGPLSSLSRSTHLVLASSLLEVGDVQGAHIALNALYQQRLTLAEALELTLVQLNYEAMIGAWPAMMRQIPRKLELAELMPSEKSARVHGMLAIAANRLGLVEWETFLKRRAELITDVNELTRRYPTLAELWTRQA